MPLPKWVNNSVHIPHEQMVCPECNVKGQITFLEAWGHTCGNCGYTRHLRDSNGHLQDLGPILKASKLYLLKVYGAKSLADAAKILASVGIEGVTLEAQNG